jgi:hypothetical protein
LSATRNLARRRPGGYKTTSVARLPAGTDVILEEDHSSTALTPADFSFETEIIDWNLLDVDAASTLDLDSEMYRKDATQLTGEFPTNHTGSYRAGPLYTGFMSPMSLSIPSMPTYNLRSFRQNPALKGGGLTTAMLMIRVLSMYPVMMQNPDALPPFIHPTSLCDTAAQPLITCVSLMQMVSICAPGSKRLLWKNVRMECERMQIEVSSSSTHRY